MVDIFEHPGDPLYWFWIRVTCLCFYVAITTRQLCRPGWLAFFKEFVSRTKQDLCPTQRVVSLHSTLGRHRGSDRGEGCFSPVTPGEIPVKQKDHQAEITFEVLTEGIGPYCCVTVAMSLIRNFSEEDPLSNHLSYGLVYGDANVLTLFIVTILSMLRARPTVMWRRIIWTILALWYAYCSLTSMLDPKLIFSEDVWLNHMVFIAITSLSLGLPRSVVWLLTLGHFCFFLVYTVTQQDSPDMKYKPSVGLQVFLVAIMAVFTKYSQVLTQANNAQAEVEFALKEVELMARAREEEARLAREEAIFASERATVAEAEARAARAENEARQAKVKAELVEQDKDAIEERANLMESTRGAFQHLLDLLCDAVVELDGDFKLNCPGKLGVLLSHGNGTDLRGRPFQGLVRPEDHERFEHWITSSENKFPLQVTLLGTYNQKVKVVLYATGIHDHHHEQTTYFVGITEAEEQLEFDYRASSKQSNSHNVSFDEFPRHSASEIYEEMVQELRSLASSGGAAKANAGGSGPSRTPADKIQPMEPEDQMQSLLALVWSWPSVEATGRHCCHTHEMLEIAIERLTTLRSLSCSTTPSCLVWQCPSCKLMGLPEEAKFFNEVDLSCARCRGWDMLF